MRLRTLLAMSKAAPLAAIFHLTFLIPAASPILGAEREEEIIDLSDTIEPLKESFNHHRDHPRFIALLSPT